MQLSFLFLKQIGLRKFHHISLFWLQLSGRTVCNELYQTKEESKFLILKDNMRSHKVASRLGEYKFLKQPVLNVSVSVTITIKANAGENKMNSAKT